MVISKYHFITVFLLLVHIFFNLENRKKIFKIVVGLVFIYMKNMEGSPEGGAENIIGYVESIAVEQLDCEPEANVWTFNDVAYTYIGIDTDWYLNLKINGKQTFWKQQRTSFLIMNYMVQLFFNILWYLRVVFFLVFGSPLRGEQSFYFLTTAQYAFLNIFSNFGLYDLSSFFNWLSAKLRRETSTFLFLYKEVFNL